MPRPLPSFLGVVMIFALACRGNSTSIEQGDSHPVPQGSAEVLADTVHLPLGVERQLDGGRLTLRLLERVNDSRCPANAICVWRGDARVRVEGKVGAVTREAVLRVANTSDSLIVGQYLVKVTELHPYPGTYGEHDPQPRPWAVVRLSRR